MKKSLLLFALILIVSTALSAQEKKSLAGFKYQFKVGVLPFMDATGGGEDTGVVVGRAVQAELAHSTNLMGRVLKLKEGMSAEDVDPEKAIELAKERRVDVVIIGTIIEASSEESERNLNGPSIFGQSGGLASRSMKATVTIQGDLFNVVNGKKIGSFRTTGKASDTKVGANVSTTLGDLSNSGSSEKSPIGKALQKAVVELVKNITTCEPQMLRCDLPGAASKEAPKSAEENQEKPETPENSEE
jgi:hypothetical protein